MIKRLEAIFIIQLAIVGLVVLGFLPRQIIPYFVLVLAIYFLKAPLAEVVTFFVRSIPFFIAIPITAAFDSLNTWRILSLIIGWRWLTLDKAKDLLSFGRKNRLQLTLWLLLGLAVVSITQAASYVLAIKRLIFLINLSLISIVVYDLVKGKPEYGKTLIRNIALPTIIVGLIGLAQLVSTYFMNIFQFMDFWGGVVERNMYGNAWADIALKANTWFAYFGDKLSLRMFSIFPDSHSFPMFLIFGLPAVLAVALKNVIAENFWLKDMLKNRGRWLAIFVPVIFLAVILSGTRGMWAAGAGSWLLVIGYWLLVKKRGVDRYHQSVFKYVSLYLGVFVILFGLAYPIFASPQFEVTKEDRGLLSKRVRSIINLGETSNARRIEIWKDSVRSIAKRPLLGVGIGNFPVVVGEDLARAKAGSSAHNLYLHIAAEMGIPALLAALYFLWLLLKKTYLNFRSEADPLALIYFAALLIFLPWNLLYSLTDVAIFDERAFLLFAATSALILGQQAIKPTR